MPDATLYDTDIVTWSATQADRLRRLRDGERVNDLDWTHVIEEIEDVGTSALRLVDSLLRQSFVHALKVIGWPDHTAARKWRNEASAFLRDAQTEYLPSMRQKLDLPRVHAAALRKVLDIDLRQPPRPLPPTTDLTVDEVMAEDFGADALIARLRRRHPRGSHPRGSHPRGSHPRGSHPIARAAPPHDIVASEGR